MEKTRILQTPIGPLGLVADAQAVTRIYFVDPEPEGGESAGAGCAEASVPDGSPGTEAVAGAAAATGAEVAAADAGTDAARTRATAADRLLEQAARELNEYFEGSRRDFTFPIAPAGTPFRQAVWAELRRIPYGEVCTYGQIAERIGRPAACRAVGMANHRNPLPVIVPCHRVVGAKGHLTGYAGGLERKSCLLALERRNTSGER